MSWIATAVVGSSVIGAGASIFGANKAADAQKDAANQAIGMQQQQYQQTRQDLSPYRDIGAQASGDLSKRLSELTSPISVDPNQLENSDYYKFASTQGQKGVTNSAAARGLGSSGAALKGAAAFAKGLATDTYKTAFDMGNTNQTNAYTRLKGLVDTGENAAAQTGALGEKAAYNSGVATIGAGNAEASADNKIGSSVSNLASNIGGYAAYKGIYGSGVTPTNTKVGNYSMPTYGLN
jgi:hypothetical protein